MNTVEQVVAELERAEETLEKLKSTCGEGLLKGKVLDAELSNLRDHLLKEVPATSPAFAAIERQSIQINTVWSDLDGYVRRANCEPIDRWLRAVNQALSTFDPEYIAKQGALKDNYYFSPREQFLALSRVLQIMRRAKSSLRYVDQYMDETVLNLVELLPDTVNVSLLTTHPKPGFALLYRALKANRAALEAREGAGFHDRFIVIDEHEVWVVGTSLNSIGDKGTTIHQNKEETELTRALADVANWWTGGTPIA
jgi:hypothetical protein